MAKALSPGHCVLGDLDHLDDLMIGMRDEGTSRLPGRVLPLTPTLAVILAQNDRSGLAIMPPLAGSGSHESTGDRGIGAGNMRLPWNMPTGILFLTTRSPRIAAFLSGTGNHKLSGNP